MQSYTWEGALTSLPPLPVGPGLSESRSGKECGLPAAKEMSPRGAAVGLKSNFQLVALQDLRSRPLSPGEVVRSGPAAPPPCGEISSLYGTPRTGPEMLTQSPEPRAQGGSADLRQGRPETPSAPATGPWRPEEEAGPGIGRSGDLRNLSPASVPPILVTTYLAWGFSEPSLQNVSHKLPDAPLAECRRPLLGGQGSEWK